MANCIILLPYDVRHHTTQSRSSPPNPPVTLGSTRGRSELGDPVRPHLQPQPFPGCDARTSRHRPPRRPADWQLPAPIRRPPGAGAGPHSRVALSVQVEAPGGAKWQEPLKGRERRRARTRPGPARPGQVPAPSGPGEPGLSGGDPGSPGGTG